MKESVPTADKQDVSVAVETCKEKSAKLFLEDRWAWNADMSNGDSV